ncbi:MAG: choice-of-anchor D domain-containing protein [Nitrospirae bacterium]|nr:choice-of-anchor D domain-containing protein [Nitrospirota bacterium]
MILMYFSLVILFAVPSFAEPITYTYDDANRLVQADSGGATVKYVYDGVGNLVQRKRYAASTIPVSYDFGSVGIGVTSAAQTFTITNTGTEGLQIGITGFDGNDGLAFSILNDNCIGQALAAETSCTLQVVFSSATAGIKNANLSISFSDPNTLKNVITLSGTGTVAQADTTPPTSQIISPVNGSGHAVNMPLTISGTSVDTGGGEVVRVDVSTDSGTSWQPATGTTSWSYAWTPAQTGSFTIRSRAVDNKDNVENPSEGVTITITVPPSAQFTVSADSGTSYKINFDGSYSICPDTPCAYSWDLGDGSTGTGVTTSHIYSDGATRTVILTVADVFGLSGNVMMLVTPTPVNLPPTASNAGLSISNYTVSFTDTSSDAPGNNPAGFLGGAVSVNWNDGAISTGDVGAIFSHTYANASTYTIVHTVTNAAGLTGSETQKVTVPRKFSITVTTTPAITGASLYVKTLAGSTVQYCTTTSSGSCTFGNLLPNTYKVQAYKSGYTFDGDPITSGNQNPVNTTVGPDQTVTFTHTP